MPTRSSLLAATALTAALAAAPALADGNAAYIDQTGNDNSALIDQDGGSGNAVGLSTDAALQNGDHNVLDILQSGSDNRVGTLGDGLEQRGSGSPTETSSANPSNLGRYQFIDIDQTSDDNVIGEILQRDRGNNQKGNNRLAVTQATGAGNVIGSIVQDMDSGKVGQIATIRQSGIGNVIGTVSQRSTSEQGSRPNVLTLTFTGDRNGAAPDGGAGVLTGAAALSGATGGVFGQSGNGNTAILDVIGNDNQIGTSQQGQLNAIGPLTVTGSFNEIGIRQVETYRGRDGFGSNVVSVGTILGSFNEIGVSQTGANTLTFGIDGDGNAFSVEQDGRNTASLSIDGDGNGGFGFAAFSGPALAIASTNDPAMAPGTIYQNGVGNEISLTIKGDAAVADSGDDNLFAFYQDGTGNRITGTQDGHANEVAISQIGTGHLTSFTQVGAFNVLGVSQ